MRFARELDEPRAQLAAYGELRLIRGAILNDWAKYGVHLVDAVLGLVAGPPGGGDACCRPGTRRWRSNSTTAPCSSSTRSATSAAASGSTSSGATASRRTRSPTTSPCSAGCCSTSPAASAMARPAVPPADALASLRLLIAGRRALAEERTVRLDELDV
jgi:hypothetical protein